jgi:hypothetical protein
MRFLVAALLVAACGKSSKIPDGPQPRPAQLVATVSLPSAASLEKLRDHVAAVRGVAAMAVDSHVVMIAAARGVAATNLEGLDASAPLHALWLDDGKLSGLAIVGKVRDDDALASGAKPAEVVTHDGWAIVGSKEIVEIAAPYALSTLVAKPPATPSATVYIDTALARYGDKIPAWRTAVMARFRRLGAVELGARGIDAFLAMMRESDELRVAVDVERGLGTLDVSLVPHPGSTVATFVALQQPSEMPLLGKLPATPGAIVVAGRFAAGPFRGKLLQSLLPALGPQLVANLGKIAGALTGDFAIAGDVGPDGLTLTQLVGLDIDNSVADATDKTLELFATRQPAAKLLADIAHDGVTIHTLEETRAVATPIAPAGTRQTALGVFDQLLVAAHAPDASAPAARAIDAARGNAPRFAPSPDFATVLAAARARRDSVVAWIDVGALRQRPSTAMALALGFADHAGHLRVAMPAATLKALF